jgi:nucleoside-diphosphate-sugar epimerase
MGAPLALQFLDEDDAARGLVAAGMSGTTGTWNLAPADWLDAHAVARIAGGRVLRLPRRALFGLSEAAFRARALPFGADRACLLSGPIALDARRAHDELGWAAARSSADVLRRALAGRRPASGVFPKSL